jgi:hypothetical protein
MSQNKNIIFKIFSDYKWGKIELAPYTWYGTDSDPKLNWEDARQACINYAGNGHTDWFLPTIEILVAAWYEVYSMGLGNFTAIDNSDPLADIGDMDADYDDKYWSANSTGLNEAHFFQFVVGYGGDLYEDHCYEEKSELMYVRPVRIVKP